MEDEDIMISSFCMGCIIKREEERVRELPSSEEKKAQYMKELCRMFADAPEYMNAPVFMAKIRDLVKEYFGIEDSYKEKKEHYNKLMLESEAALSQMIENSENPLQEALRLARVGNYIDFGGMNTVDDAKLAAMFAESEKDVIDEKEWQALLKDLGKAKSLVYLTDNCGEIVLDKLFIKKIKERYPSLEITAIVRGGIVSNDATLEDAQTVGLTEVVKVIGNGSSIAGTALGYISEEAESLIRNADVVISKGQGNFESLNGCGLNIYYLFLCKCDWMVRRFQMKRLTGILVNDRNLPE